MRKIKDSTVIGLLILTWLFIFCGVLGTENEIDRLQKQIDENYTSLNDLSIEVTAELAEHEDRLELLEHNYEVLKIRVGNHYDRLMSLEETVSSHQEILTKPTPTPKSTSRTKVNVKVSQKDIRNIAALVYLECGSCSDRCKRAVASVVFNRMMRYHKTASQAIYEKGVFSVSGRVSRTKPSQSCLDAVNYVLNHGTTLPLRVTAFRNGHYHSFGKHYCKIDGVYFTYV